MTDFIKTFWDSSADTHGTSHWASWGDNWAIQLEIEEIEKHIKDNYSILDVGCSNGYAAFKHVISNSSIHIEGIDFSKKMIDQANKQLKIFKANNISFSVGDVRNIQLEDEMYDLVYTSRVIINLPNWEEQVKAVKECIRVTRTGGKIILSEAFWEPLMKLNSIRAIMGLPPLVEHDFNRYLKKEKLKTLLNDLGHSYEIIDFSSLYYFGSRVLRELITDHKKYKGYDNPINEDFFHLEQKYSGGDVGVQQAFVIIK